MRDHTSLIAWQRARAVTRGVLAAARQNREYGATPILNQLRRSALSVQLNIAEGYARGQRRSFAYHLGVAYGSAVEAGELLALCRDEQILSEEVVSSLLRDCGECQRVVLGLLRQVKRSND